jgi:hypothetical protein
MKQKLQEIIQYEKRNLFEVKFPEEFQILNEYVIEIDKPKIISEEWEPIQITFYGVIKPCISKIIYELQKSSRILETDKGYSFEFNIITLDKSKENEIENWLIQVKDVSVDFGEHNIYIDDRNEISLIVQPFDCILT